MIRMRLIIAALSLLGIAGCVTSVETESYRVSRNPNIESAQVVVDADFGRYDRLFVEPMGIYFPKDHAPSKEDQDRTRQIFREAFRAELEGYSIVGEKGPSALLIQASLIDFRLAENSDVMSVRRGLRDMATPGSLVFLMELRDSETDRELARAADSASAPTFASSSGTYTDWEAVEAAAANWAVLFRNFLDENLNK